MLNIADIEFNNAVNGPGTRTVIWFQGCTLACKGCWNKHLWNNEPKQLYSTEQLLNIIKEQGNNVTFTGGEPLQQDLIDLTVGIKKLGLNLFLFTGYRPEEVSENTVFKLADFVKTGRYGEEQQGQVAQNIQIDIDSSGNMVLTGYPTNAFIKSLTTQKEYLY